MIDIKINKKNNENIGLIKPQDIDPFNTAIYEILDNGEPDQSYFFCDGGQVMYFYECDNGMRLGYQTKEDLKSFLSHIKCRKVNGKISININIED